MTMHDEVNQIAQLARSASNNASRMSMKLKEKMLLDIAQALRENKALLQAENEKDLKAGKEKGLSSAMLDRLTLSDKVIEQTASGIEEIAAFPDPVGEIVKMWIRPNGMRVGKMRIPLGVVGIIYESRPNVTADAGALCLKSGNAVILRGGSEAFN